MKRNQGITLIALIITIILLLILVGVSLNLLLKGDLFGNAEKAVSSTNAKVEEQQTRVDELMDRMDRASVFAEGTKPTLKYKVYGDDVLVYLEHSYYDYISKMSIEEKEKILANSTAFEPIGYLDDTYYKAVSNSTTEKFIAKTGAISNNRYSSIEELIDDMFKGDRKYYEYALAEESGSYLNYEETLNTILIMIGYEDELLYYKWLYLDFAENVLHIKNNLSVSEKEKKIASLTGGSLTQVGVMAQEMANELGVSYSKVLDMFLNMIEMQELGEEEIVQASKVTLTLPTGESGPLYYGLIRTSAPEGARPNSYIKTNQEYRPSLKSYANYIGMFITNVTNSGRYIYTAENYKGTKAEVTVPVELRRANFKVKVSDTETRTYEFIEGQSWGQFVGEKGYNIMDDSYVFYEYDCSIVYRYHINESTLNSPYRVASLNMPKLKVALTDDSSERKLLETESTGFQLKKVKK